MKITIRTLEPGPGPGQNKPEVDRIPPSFGTDADIFGKFHKL